MRSPSLGSFDQSRSFSIKIKKTIAIAIVILITMLILTMVIGIVIVTSTTRFSLNPGDYLERRSTWKLIFFAAAAALLLLLLITVSLRLRKTWFHSRSRNRVAIAIELIEEGSIACGQMLTTLFFPPLPFLFQVLVYPLVPPVPVILLFFLCFLLFLLQHFVVVLQCNQFDWTNGQIGQLFNVDIF